MEFSRPENEWVAFPFSRGSSLKREEPRSPALQEDSLPVEVPGKPWSDLAQYIIKLIVKAIAVD